MELTVEQKRIVDSKPNGHNLVKGVAGSGKTTVAVRKIPNLMNHYLSSTDRVLIVTYNKTLKQYIEYVYEKSDIDYQILFDNAKERTEIKTIDQIIYNMYINRQKKIGKDAKEWITDAKKREFFELAIYQVSKKYPNQTIVSNKNIQFLMDEIDWMKSCKYNDKETYLHVDRIGRKSGHEEQTKFALQKSSVNRAVIYELFMRYESIQSEKGYIDSKTMALLILRAIENEKINVPQYAHLIIDESQDLTRVQIEILSKMYKEQAQNSSITFIADTAQSIYAHSWLAFHSFKSVGFDMSGRAKILSRNYRTTIEIAQAAYSMIEQDEEITKNENYVKAEAIEKHGDMPVYKFFSNVNGEIEFIKELIKNRLCTRYNLNEIAILARTKAQLNTAKAYLIEHGISVKMFDSKEIQFDKDEVFMTTLHSIKGLEFSVIIILGINDGILPYEKGVNVDNNESMERKLLYVGMTRAKKELYLTSSGKASKFIQEIHPAFLSSMENEFARFRNIGIENYQFKNKIFDIYSVEEIVRQWFIYELITKLSYPIEMMDIEYGVQAFSKLGYVDLVVFDIVDGKKVPVIFVEMKKRGENLSNAMIQLKQYISCYETVRYGAVTDGEELICLEKDKKDFKVIQKLPKYNQNIGNVHEHYEYVDLRSKKKYVYHVNQEDKEEILVKQKNSDYVIPSSEYYQVNIYGKVAAGAMQFASEEMIDCLKIPNDVLYDHKECFGLLVNGDSMIDAGIQKGDYVIIHKQNYANRRDIVIAVDRESNEATMKRYNFSKGKVILEPENELYEPIILDEKDVVINGVVLGIFKK